MARFTHTRLNLLKTVIKERISSIMDFIVSPPISMSTRNLRTCNYGKDQAKKLYWIRVRPKHDDNVFPYETERTHRVTGRKVIRWRQRLE